MSQTYPNADARPHTGDRVKIDATKTPQLRDDVTGRVSGSHNDKIKVRYGPQAGTHLFGIDALTLLEATDTRFDGFEPGVVEEWEPPAVRYGTYVPSGHKGALVIDNSTDTVKLKRKPTTDDKRVIQFMANHGWEHQHTRDEVKSHGVMVFRQDHD